MITAPYTSSPAYSRWIDIFFWAFFVLILVNRFILFLQLNLDHIDSDQPIMWLGTRHFSEGLFYAPRFYGQDYNTFLEAFLAAPLVKLGLPVYYAVPLVTHLLFLIPFLFTAVYLLKKQKKTTALLILCILLCMPTGYDMLTALPRGFVTGILFTTPYILSILNPRRASYIFLNSFMAYLAYLVNPNSLLVSLPFLFYLFLLNYKSSKYYFFTLGGLTSLVPVHYLLYRFYSTRPDYVLHDFENSFSLFHFKQAIQHLDERFAHINFFVDGQSAFLLLVMTASGILFFRKNRRAFYAYLLFLAIVLVSFSSSKIADGVPWAYYSYSRMYLGIPVLLYLFLTSCDLPEGRYVYAFVAVTLVFLPWKEIRRNDTIAYETDMNKWVFLHLASLKNTKEIVSHYKEVCRQHNVQELVVAGDLFCKEELGYGGPALDPQFPKTLLSAGERRAWRIREERDTVRSSFVLISTDYNLDKKGMDTLCAVKLTRLDDYGCFLVENNTKNLLRLLEELGTPVNGKREQH